jgi:hypothetical protein
MLNHKCLGCDKRVMFENSFCTGCLKTCSTGEVSNVAFKFIDFEKPETINRLIDCIITLSNYGVKELTLSRTAYCVLLVKLLIKNPMYKLDTTATFELAGVTIKPDSVI